MSTQPSAQTEYKCEKCGAAIEYKPGTDFMICPYCQHQNKIQRVNSAVEELDFEAWLRKARDDAETVETKTVTCTGCAAVLTIDQHVTSDACPFCGGQIVLQGTSKKVIKPRSVLPFKVERRQGEGLYKQWISSLWFAPSNLKRRAETTEHLFGMYTPYWTYDADTTTFYQGERGDDYWTTETYTSMENGRSVTKTRQVKKTRWTSVSGTVYDKFDDLLVLASQSLPRDITEELEPWDLKNLVPYQDEYLSGFRAESYSVDLEQGFGIAKDLMEPTIDSSIRRNIGGDHQRINSKNTRYSNITFKHVLLPIWISAYRYNKKIFRIVINGRTGEVQGERPWSWMKITALVMFIIAIIVAVYLMFVK